MFQSPAKVSSTSVYARTRVSTCPTVCPPGPLSHNRGLCYFGAEVPSDAPRAALWDGDCATFGPTGPQPLWGGGLRRFWSRGPAAPPQMSGPPGGPKGSETTAPKAGCIRVVQKGQRPLSESGQGTGVPKAAEAPAPKQRRPRCFESGLGPRPEAWRHADLPAKPVELHRPVCASDMQYQWPHGVGQLCTIEPSAVPRLSRNGVSLHGTSVAVVACRGKPALRQPLRCAVCQLRARVCQRGRTVASHVRGALMYVSLPVSLPSPGSTKFEATTPFARTCWCPTLISSELSEVCAS